MTSFQRTARVLEEGLRTEAFSAVTAEVGRVSRREWRFAAGRLGFGPESQPVGDESIFDLASLTKVLCTSTLALQLVSSRRLDIATPVTDLLSVAGLKPRATDRDEWSASGRASVTVRDLLEHCSGLPAHRLYFLTRSGRHEYQDAIVREPLAYEPRQRSIYSDLGFILLGFLLEDIGEDPLAKQFEAWRSCAGVTEPLWYGVPREYVERVAMTEQDPWRGRVLQGEVHDENAAALGGTAGHAGLFGTARAVGQAARWWLARLHGEDDPATGITSRLALSFAARSTVPGSSRALGWDTMLPTSSCGTRLSARAIGHTGYTGTSLWIDPAQDLYAVLLTNRVHPSRHNDQIQHVRRAFHDAIAEDLNP